MEVEVRKGTRDDEVDDKSVIGLKTERDPVRGFPSIHYLVHPGNKG